ncbi:MAG TPA: ornithine cyclodeaminase family protein [Usitatibacter sp.]|nr:ornithine cyclodeaminase family protein [Usitatibacter sp.]
MKHFTDADVDRVLAGAPIEDSLRRAFVALAEGRAAQQPRLRTDAGGVKLSTLGGVIPELGVAGAKVYTTLAGRFSFLIALFSTQTGEPLATFEANAITKWRTAAVSRLAASVAARPEPRAIAVFGTGVQGRSHAEAFSRAYPRAELRIVERRQSGGDIARALQGADIIVTATRSATPLFDGNLVERAAFVAAVGSSRPDTRELDDTLLSRAARVIVEWREQTLQEAGDLLLAPAELRSRLRIVDLGDVLAGKAPARESGDDIVIFKSVGVGIEDVAVAGLAYGLLKGH